MIDAEKLHQAALHLQSVKAELDAARKEEMVALRALEEATARRKQIEYWKGEATRKFFVAGEGLASEDEMEGATRRQSAERHDADDRIRMAKSSAMNC